MKYAVLAALLLAAPAQDRLSPLLDTLRNGTLEERDAVQEELLALGIPSLRSAAARFDGDVRARLTAAIRVLEIRAQLPAEVIESIPDADRRVADGRLTWHELVRIGMRRDDDGEAPWPQSATSMLFGQIDVSSLALIEIAPLLSAIWCAAPGDAFRICMGVLRRKDTPPGLIDTVGSVLRGIDARSDERLAEVRTLLGDPRIEVQREAVRLLARWKAPDLTAIYRRMVPIATASAAGYLSEHDPDWLRHRLTDLFESRPDVALRHAAHLGREDLIEHALSSIHHDTPDGRLVTLLHSMAEMEHHDALIPALRLLQRSDNAEWDLVGDAACAVIIRVTRHEDAALLDGLFESADPEVRRRASLLLGNVPIADDRILALASDPDVVIRRRVAGVRLRGRNTALAQTLLKDRDPNVLVETLEQLCRGGRGKDVTAAIVSLLAHPSDDVRMAAVRYLLVVGETSRAAELVPLLADESFSVRSWASYALASWGDSSHAKEILAIVAEMEDSWRGEPPGSRESRKAIKRLDVGAVRSALRDLVSSENETVAAYAISCIVEDRGALIAIRRALASPNAGVRHEAVSAAGRLRDRESIPTILSILDDDVTDRGGQSAALRVIAVLGDVDPEEIVKRLSRLPFGPALGTLLALGFRKRLPNLALRAAECEEWKSAFIYGQMSGDSSLREDALRLCTVEAARYLRAIGPGDDLKPLLANLDRRYVRGHAASVLALVPEDRLRATVRALFSSGSIARRRAALALVKARRWSEFAPDVCRLTRDVNGSLALEALDALRDLPRAATVEALREAAKDDRWQVAEEATVQLLDLPDGWTAVHSSMLPKALGVATWRRDSRAKSVALRCLESNESGLRSEAVRLLTVLGDPSILQEVRRILREVPAARTAAAGLLAEFGDVEAVAARRAALDDAWALPYLQGQIDDECFEALARNHNPEAGLDCDRGILEGATSFAPRWRGSLIGYIERRRLLSAVPLLLSWASSRDEEAQDWIPEAAHALARLGGSEAISGLVKLLDHDVDIVAIAALNALVAIRAPGLCDSLRSLLDRPAVRDAAIQGLVVLRDRESIPRITMALEGPSAAAAAYALGVFGAKDAAPRISRLLDHPDDGIANAAARALIKLQAAAFYPRILEQSPRRGPRTIAALLCSARWAGAAGLFRAEGEYEGLLRLGLEEAREPALAWASLLSNSSLLWWLNSLRHAEATEVLYAKPLDLPEGWVALRDLAAALSNSFGVTVTLDAGLDTEHTALGSTVGVHALLSSDFGFRFALIVDKAAVRIVRRADAMESWKAPAAARR